jgi:hypothetical protein
VQAARYAIESFRDVIRRREIWRKPELQPHEEAFSRIHLRELLRAGFPLVSNGTSPKAFVETGQL